MLGFSPLGARPLGAPFLSFANTIQSAGTLPGLLSEGLLQRTSLIHSVSTLPGLIVSAMITHPYAWTPVPPADETWTAVPSESDIWTPVPKSPEVWS